MTGSLPFTREDYVGRMEAFRTALRTTMGPGFDLALEPRMVFHMGAYVLIPGKWAIAASQTIMVTPEEHENLTKTEKGPLFL